MEIEPPRTSEQPSDERPEALDPQDTDRLREKIKGQTTEHATPPRLEDEGQSGG
ncbi:MAG: hypothetical protein JO211_14480 [Acidobacteriaceae bacterium]|nr:hypothetical protein [Acidobacteriaceae bacterium]